MKKSHLLSLLLLVFICFSATAQKSIKTKTVKPLAFADQISTTFAPQIIDVRTPEEFKLGHIENAKNNNWLGNSFVADTQILDKTKPVFVYCKSGNRSSKAVKKLEELGFETIYELDGGYVQWELTSFEKPKTSTIGMSMQEFNTLLESERLVLINFTGNCPSCQQMEPTIAKLGKELTDKVQIITIDFEKNKTIATELEVEDLPALLLYRNKNIYWRQSGIITEAELKKQLQ